MSDGSKKPASDRPKGEQFGIVEARIVRDKTLPRNVRTIYAYLATFASHDDREAFPGQARMADETGLSGASITIAVKTGVEVGLWTVSHKRHPVNTYILHDRAWVDGAYVVGSGPGERAKGKPRGTHAATAPSPVSRSGSAQTVGMESPTVGSYQDQPSHSSVTTRSTSSDAASGAPRTSSPGDDETEIRIFLPRNFAKMEDGDAFQHLVACSISALRAVGKEPAADAADRIGRALKATAQEKTRDEMVELLKGTLRLAGTDHEAWGSLATPRRLTA